MKTALERIFEKHDKEFDKMNFLQWLSDNRKELLKAEKEQIMEAWDNGNTCGTEETMGGIPEFYIAEHYYQQTFKSDE